MSARDRGVRLALAAFVAAVVLYPFEFGSDYGLGAGITAGAMAISTVGFVLLIGFAHQLALGQAAFCMIGAYGSVFMVLRFGWDPFVAMLVAMALAMAAAYLVGRPILKLRGFNLAMASLALQLVLIFAAVQAEDVTGGAVGISGVPKFAIFGWTMNSDRVYFYFIWLIVLLCILVGLNIDRSHVGRALKAIAASETAAGSVGIDLAIRKAQMFVLSAGMASLTGSLTVHYLRVIEPQVFGLQFSLTIITAVIVGGLMSIWGGALGAAVIVALREGLRVLSLPLVEGIVMGALTVLVLILFPRGVAGAIADLYGRLVRRGAAAAASEPAWTRGDAADPASIAVAPADAAGSAEGPFLRVEHARRSFGSLVAVDDVGFEVPRHSITALIGPNGAGKTTMFDLISGHQAPDRGRILFEGRAIETYLPQRIAALGIGRTFQNLQLFDNMTVRENVACGCERRISTGILAVALGLKRVAREEQALRHAADHYLAFVGLDAMAERRPDNLAFGHRRLLEIARALAVEPVLLLMDEPASGLNDTETERLADLILRIRAQGTTILLVEHDIRLVMGLADHVVVMNHGEKIMEGPPDAVRRDPRVIDAYLGA
jgi:branched-chain amino acid transport system permease protein